MVFKKFNKTYSRTFEVRGPMLLKLIKLYLLYAEEVVK